MLVVRVTALSRRQEISSPSLSARSEYIPTLRPFGAQRIVASRAHRVRDQRRLHASAPSQEPRRPLRSFSYIWQSCCPHDTSSCHTCCIVALRALRDKYGLESCSRRNGLDLRTLRGNKWCTDAVPNHSFAVNLVVSSSAMTRLARSAMTGNIRFWM